MSVDSVFSHVAWQKFEVGWLNFPLGSDFYPHGEVAAKYGIVGMPTVVFIDGRGREVPGRVTGAVDGPEMVRALREVDGACDAAERKPSAPAGLTGETVVACAARW